MPVPVVLVHGAATTPAIWDLVTDALHARGIDDVEAVRRPCAGDLDTEVAFLAESAAGALVVGQSGGATLALALAAAGAPIAGAVCHEPAAGSLVPGLLAPMAAAYAAGGIDAFGAILYGPSWSRADAGGDPDAVRRDLPMFRGFEPSPSRLPVGSALVTVGELSPGIRHDVARALRVDLGYPTAVVAGSGHFVARDAPDAFAEVIARHAVSLGD